MLDRAISTKFLTHRVSLRGSYPIFEKKFCLTKNGGHFEFSKFSQKLQNIKMLISRKPYYIERFQRNFWPTGYLCRVLIPIFKKFLSCQKWQPFRIFEFFAKIAKHKNAYILKTVLDTAISTKFLTHRVSLCSGYPNFEKIYVSPKMAAILNFRIFRKITKHKNAYISKTVLDRAISTKFLTHRVALQSSHAYFQQNFVSSKMADILNFPQKLQNIKMLISRKPY